MKRGLGSKPLTEIEIKEAQSKSLSAFEASRTLGVSYNTYKKYARQYGIMEDLKNPSGVGLKRVSRGNRKFNWDVKPKNISQEDWDIKLRRRELKKKHIDKYHNDAGDIEYGCALYIITIPNGNKRLKYINKWGHLPVKIGISKDVVKRYSKLILEKSYAYSDKDKWVEWNDLAEVINIIPFYTYDECVRVESRIHAYIKDYRIEGLVNKKGNKICELFDAPFEKINEAIDTYTTGWRSLNWDSTEMNNIHTFW
jgi:hypothetical protein